jgi:hypothetical protein
VGRSRAAQCLSVPASNRLLKFATARGVRFEAALQVGRELSSADYLDGTGSGSSQRLMLGNMASLP